MADIPEPASKAPWGMRAWALAALIPACFFAFEAVSISTYPALRAPNVTLAQQIGIMGSFYGVWIIVPRIAWELVPDQPAQVAPKRWRRAVVSIAVAGACLATLHLLLLTAVLRLMHAPPGGRLGDFLYSFGEVMLGFAPIWLLAFAAVVAVPVLFKNRTPSSRPTSTRIEVRDRGHIRMLDTDQIEWVQASGNYVEYHTDIGKVLARQSLRSLKDTLLQAGFVASHRSAMVNPRHIASIKTGGQGTGHRIIFRSGDEAPLSRRNLKRVRETALGGETAD